MIAILGTYMHELVVIIISILSALATQELSIFRKYGPVKASAAVSLFVGGLFYSLPVFFNSFPEFASTNFFQSMLVMSIPALTMGASFVAMSSKNTIPDRKYMAVGGLVFALIFLLSKPTFKGYGGVLGTGACFSVVMTIGIMRFINFLKKSGKKQ